MTDAPKFCKDCKHFIPDSLYDRCSEPRALNRVTADPGFASILRGAGDLDGYCGAAGDWFSRGAADATRPWWRFWK